MGRFPGMLTVLNHVAIARSAASLRARSNWRTATVGGVTESQSAGGTATHIDSPHVGGAHTAKGSDPRRRRTRCWRLGADRVEDGYGRGAGTARDSRARHARDGAARLRAQSGRTGSSQWPLRHHRPARTRFLAHGRVAHDGRDPQGRSARGLHGHATHGSHREGSATGYPLPPASNTKRSTA